MTTYTLAEIANALSTEALGDSALVLRGLSEPQDAAADQLALAFSESAAAGLSTSVQAALLWSDADWKALGLKGAICVPRPRFSLGPLSKMFDEGPKITKGVHPAAVVNPSAKIGQGASIGPFVVIGADALIGAGAQIGAHCSIGYGTKIGARALIHPGVHIGHNVTIGDDFTCQSGTVIGSDGFSFVTPDKAPTEQIRETLGERGETAGQHWTRIHSLGSVTIGDYVDIGANTCIDRGTIRDTKIGNRTKIDNFVQLAHNAVVGEDCLLCGASGVAGSSTLGNRVVLAGQSGVVDNVTVGDDVILSGGGKIRSNQPAGRVLMGDPAITMKSGIEQYKALRRLPRIAKDVAALKKAPNSDIKDG